MSLTIPLAAASLSRPRTVATLTPMGVFSRMLTDVSDVMSNSGLLSFSSRMVIDTWWEQGRNKGVMGGRGGERVAASVEGVQLCWGGGGLWVTAPHTTS